MNKLSDKLYRIVENRIDKLSRSSYHTLSLMKFPFVEEIWDDKQSYQIEIDQLELTETYIHILVSADDGGWSAFRPPSKSFLVYKDGRIGK